MTTRRILRGPGYGTPASRNTGDRYIVRRGALTWNWMIEDTHTGVIIENFRPEAKQAADVYVYELNQQVKVAKL